MRLYQSLQQRGDPALMALPHHSSLQSSYNGGARRDSPMIRNIQSDQPQHTPRHQVQVGTTGQHLRQGVVDQVLLSSDQTSNIDISSASESDWWPNSWKYVNKYLANHLKIFGPEAENTGRDNPCYLQRFMDLLSHICTQKQKNQVTFLFSQSRCLLTYQLGWDGDGDRRCHDRNTFIFYAVIMMMMTMAMIMMMM